MNLEAFYAPDPENQKWGNLQELERWRRIRASVAAFAYEIHAHSFLTDAEYDELCLLIDTSVLTGNAKLDKFFGENFNPSTGQWIYKHPDLSGIEQLYEKYYKERCK